MFPDFEDPPVMGSSAFHCTPPRKKGDERKSSAVHLLHNKNSSFGKRQPLGTTSMPKRSPLLRLAARTFFQSIVSNLFSVHSLGTCCCGFSHGITHNSSSEPQSLWYAPGCKYHTSDETTGLLCVVCLWCCKGYLGIGAGSSIHFISAIVRTFSIAKLVTADSQQVRPKSLNLTKLF